MIVSSGTDMRLVGIGGGLMYPEEVRLQSKQPFLCLPRARSGGAHTALQTQMGV